jgi:hypothetical protein
MADETPPTPHKAIDRFLANGAHIDRIMRDAVRQALSRHKRLGQSIVVWRDGHVVEIPPEEIPVDEGDGTPARPAGASPDAPEAA